MGRSVFGAGDGLAPSLPTLCFLVGGGWARLGSFPLVSPTVAITESAPSRQLAAPRTFGSGWWGSRVMVETRKDGKESLLGIWVLPSPPDWDFQWSLLLEAGSSSVPPLALAEEVSPLAVEASHALGLASGKLEEELRVFSGRVAGRKELCPVTEGDRFMLLGLPASVSGF